MKVNGFGLRLTLLLFLCAGCSSKPGADPSSQLDGEWIVLELNEKGTPAKEETKKHLHLTFKNGQVRQYETSDEQQTARLSRPEEWAIRVDPAKKPAEIDFVCLQGADAGKTRFGIYLVEGTKLKIARGDLEAPRPTDFNPNPEITLMTLERQP
jgi:uncharacterized protein (TIGR03067 family)